MEGLGPDIRKLAEEPVYTDGFKPGAQNPRISQTTSSGFPNNEVFSAKESLKLPEGSVYLLSALHPGVLSKTSFEGKRQGCVCVCVCGICFNFSKRMLLLFSHPVMSNSL